MTNLNLFKRILCDSGLDIRDVYYNPKVHNSLFWKLKEVWLQINCGLISSYGDGVREDTIELLSNLMEDEKYND